MKNFFDCKNEKITEKAFSQSLIISAVSILLCIVMLCSITYAWFTSETSSNSNTLTSGCFDITVDIEKTDGAAATASETVTFAEYTLTKAGTYTVTLEPTSDATVKGYCIVTIDSNVYRTDVILDEDMLDETYNTKTAPFKFTIVTYKNDTVVKFESHWGVLVNPEIKEKANISVGDSQIEIRYDDVTE